ncbi:unnamed protein product [Orchesella dallaii]|uniref:F-box domain-containing protein n=1 Tax=Orchesella dallaii TaxID=48710 RepID=A0ABP1QCR6_9HEXA
MAEESLSRMDLEGPEEEKFPLDLFPLEVWGEIFGNLTRSNDLTNIYNTTACWRKFLQPQRATFIKELIAKAFLILDNERRFSGRDILRLRLLSYTWKEVIDHFLQTHPHHLDIGFSKARTFPEYFSPIHKFHRAKLERFMEWTRNYPSTDPFFSRSVSYQELTFSEAGHLRMHLTPAHNIPRQRLLFREVLNQFGEQIWYITLSFTVRNTKQEEFYELIHAYLSHMPNLRALTIRVQEGVDNPHERTPELMSLLDTLPLPHLEDLLLLSLRNVPEPLQTALLLRYNQVERLAFQNSTGCHPSFPPHSLQDLDFSKLEQLRIFSYCDQDFQHLHLKSTSWALTHMNLRWIQITDLNLVFRAISSFSGTLKKLMLEFRGVRIHDFHEQAEEKLRLPNLEMVKITAVQSYLNSLDFLMPCLNLKEIHLNIWIPANPQIRLGPAASIQVIQWAGWLNDLDSSNIWRVFRNLKKIEIKTVTNSRIDMEVPVRDKYLYTRLRSNDNVQGGGGE